MLKLTANRETLIHRASEQAEFFSRKMEIEQFRTTNESVVDGNHSILFLQRMLLAKKFSGIKMTSNSG